MTYQQEFNIPISKLIFHYFWQSVFENRKKFIDNILKKIASIFETRIGWSRRGTLNCFAVTVIVLLSSKAFHVTVANGHLLEPSEKRIILSSNHFPTKRFHPITGLPSLYRLGRKGDKGFSAHAGNFQSVQYNYRTSTTKWRIGATRNSSHSLFCQSFGSYIIGCK